ncbi:MAG: hypothetical protein JNK88_04730 [Mangrovicoccus sp.]|nr:hypothetical protein [Mangrovicoccus sp.]
MKRLVALAALAAAVAFPAVADQALMDRPLAAGSLHDGSVDLVVYDLPAADGALEVTATYAARDGGEPARLVMALAEGQAVQFALPGHRDTVYSFTRTGAQVSVTSAPVGSAKIQAKL